MADKLIDIKINPGRTDLVVFAFLWGAFFVVLGVLALGTETLLRSAGIVTGAAWLISLALNRDYPRRVQLLGGLIPAALLGIWGFEHWARTSGPAWLGGGGSTRWLWLSGDRAAWSVLFGLGVVGVAGTLLMLGSMWAGTGAAARRLYRGWMFAALPIGWVMSHVVLGLVYFGVVTPIGLVRRALGHDPMQRRLDRGASTYWQPHAMPTSAERYFEQF